MTNPLKIVADYSKSRISLEDIDVGTYVTTDNLLQNKQGKVNAEKMPKQSSNNVTRFDEGDILVANIRPYLKKIWLAKYTGGSSSDVLTFKVRKNFDSTFVYYSLFRDDFFEHMMNGSKGTKMPRGDKNQILDFPNPDFKFETQKQIAKVLSDLDAKIEVNNKINQELEAMAKTLYDYWFVQFDFPDVNGKPYKYSGGKMVFNEALKREIPEGWEVGTLLDIANFQNGLACQKFRPVDENYLPVIKIKEMRDGFTGKTEKVKKDVPDRIKIYDGDILFSWSASLEVMIWSGGNGALNQHIFKVTSGDYPKSYYYFELLNYLQHFKMIADLRKTTMGHITQDHLKQSRIVIPPITLCEEIEKKISPILKSVVSNQQQNQKLSELRDWLLPMLMNGQVRVSDSRDGSLGKVEQELGMVAESNVEYWKS
ncbi:type I restriction modification protein [Neptunitalea chrysea]|uniref:Type I restriction modification protein n=1 Tax=Neptunitalea chrysea TaxID=1647581 RepID=A0A9W6B4U5_9FLAO|nr:restriction endonuclease subunit S [Neptunitalea chrysea]GLB51342.1 type I restriction modification protein [Neptunitalea chrysea]